MAATCEDRGKGWATGGSGLICSVGAGRGTNTGFGVVTAIARVETAVEGATDGAVLGDPTRAATPTSKAVSADKPPIAAIVPRNTFRSTDLIFPSRRPTTPEAPSTPAHPLLKQRGWPANATWDHLQVHRVAPTSLWVAAGVAVPPAAAQRRSLKQPSKPTSALAPEPRATASPFNTPGAELLDAFLADLLEGAFSLE